MNMVWTVCNDSKTQVGAVSHTFSLMYRKRLQDSFGSLAAALVVADTDTDAVLPYAGRHADHSGVPLQGGVRGFTARCTQIAAGLLGPGWQVSAQLCTLRLERMSVRCNPSQLQSFAVVALCSACIVSRRAPTSGCNCATWCCCCRCCRKGSPPVRAVLAGAMHVLTNPPVLAAAFGDGTDAPDAAARCESALVQVRGLTAKCSCISSCQEHTASMYHLQTPQGERADSTLMWQHPVGHACSG